MDKVVVGSGIRVVDCTMSELGHLRTGRMSVGLDCATLELIPLAKRRRVALR